MRGGVPFDEADLLLAGVGLVEIFRVVGQDELVLQAVDEEGGDVGLAHVVADGVQVFDVEVVLLLDGGLQEGERDAREQRVPASVLLG